MPYGESLLTAFETTHLFAPTRIPRLITPRCQGGFCTDEKELLWIILQTCKKPPARQKKVSVMRKWKTFFLDTIFE
jgi:hypothetical protein